MAKMIRLKSVLASGVCVLALASTAFAQMRHYDIPAGDLKTALDAYARQSGQQIIYRIEDVHGQRANAVRGELSANQALQQIVAGTSLRIRREESGAVAVVRPQPQSASAGATQDDAKITTLDEIVVTGTNIRGNAPTGSPLTVIDRDEIERSGYSSTAQVVRSLPQNFQGAFDESAKVANVATDDNGRNTSGGSAANLRGLGAEGTLTLLNGHRLSASGDSSAADLSLIPLSAIERIEVLPDGASAIYGSDAVGGVLNIILRDDFDGAETLVEYGGTTQGSYRQKRLSQNLGRTWRGGGGLISYEYRDQEPLLQSERDFTPSPIPGSVLIPAEERQSLLMIARQKISPRIDLSGDAILAKREGGSLLPIGLTLAFEVEQVSGTAALDLQLSDTWTATLSSTVSHSNVTDTVGVPALDLSFPQTHDNKAWDFVARISGELIDLPSGPLQVAVGGEHRTSEFDTQGNFNVLASRDINVAYGELNIPLVSSGNALPFMSQLTVSVAGRYENYSDFGEAKTYKLGFSWDVTDEFTFRGTRGTSFRAPHLIETSGPNTALIAEIPDPNSSSGTAVTFFQTGYNRELDPERARSFTLGADYDSRKLPGLRASFTYFETNYDDRIGLPLLNILGILQQPELYAPFIIRNPTPAQLDAAYAAFPVAFNPGEFTPADIDVIADGRLQNLASLDIRGFDVSATHEFETAWGDFTTQAAATRFLDYLFQLVPGGPVNDTADTALNPSTWKGRFSVGWDREHWSASGAINYVNAHVDQSTFTPQHIDDFTTVDLRGAYRFQGRPFEGLEAAVAVQNVFDVDPPRVDSLAIGYDPTKANPFGRVVTVTLRKRW